MRDVPLQLAGETGNVLLQKVILDRRQEKQFGGDLLH